MITQIHRTLLIKISIGFVVFVIIGTLSHELSHFAVAKSLGYESVLHYNQNSWFDSTDTLDSIYREYSKEIKEGLTFPKRFEYEIALRKFERDKLLITLGGVLVTIGFGTLAFVLLLFRSNKRLEFSTREWLLVFLSLFWVREVINLILGLIKGIVHQEHGYFVGDELEISKALGLYDGTVPILLGIIGTGICLYTIFKIIPYTDRTTFILSGLIGGTVGIVLWFFLIGPILFP